MPPQSSAVPAMQEVFQVFAGLTTSICLLPLPQQYSVYPIIWAAGRGHAEIVHLLLQHEAKVNCSDKVTTYW